MDSNLEKVSVLQDNLRIMKKITGLLHESTGPLQENAIHLAANVNILEKDPGRFIERLKLASSDPPEDTCADMIRYKIHTLQKHPNLIKNKNMIQHIRLLYDNMSVMIKSIDILQNNIDMLFRFTDSSIKNMDRTPTNSTSMQTAAAATSKIVKRLIRTTGITLKSASYLLLVLDPTQKEPHPLIVNQILINNNIARLHHKTGLVQDGLNRLIDNAKRLEEKASWKRIPR